MIEMEEKQIPVIKGRVKGKLTVTHRDKDGNIKSVKVMEVKTE